MRAVFFLFFFYSHIFHNCSVTFYNNFLYSTVIREGGGGEGGEEGGREGEGKEKKKCYSN